MLGALEESPEYDAMISPVPPMLPVILTEQNPELSAQDDEEKLAPISPVCVKVTVPVGLAPVMVAVQVEEDPESTGEGVHVTEVEVGAWVLPPGL